MVCLLCASLLRTCPMLWMQPKLQISWACINCATGLGTFRPHAPRAVMVSMRVLTGSPINWRIPSGHKIACNLCSSCSSLWLVFTFLCCFPCLLFILSYNNVCVPCCSYFPPMLMNVLSDCCCREFLGMVPLSLVSAWHCGVHSIHPGAGVCKLASVFFSLDVCFMYFWPCITLVTDASFFYILMICPK